MRRREVDADTDGVWPPERLRHFRLEDWPGKVDPRLRPLAVDCAWCAFDAERGAWLAARPDGPLDPVLRCCPAWETCQADDASWAGESLCWHDEVI